MIDDECEINFTTMTKEQVIEECERREKVAHMMWNAIAKSYGPPGVIKILTAMQSLNVRDLPKDAHFAMDSV